MNWLKSFRGNIKKFEPLKSHTTFKIGGKALFWCEPKDYDDLALFLNESSQRKLKVLLIGSGSNLLVSDRLLRKAVVKLDSPFFKKMSVKGCEVEVGSGVLLSRLVAFATHHHLSGVEFLTGIPGTLGGALAMNAGIVEKSAAGKTRWRCMGNVAKEVTIMDYRGTIKTLKKNQLNFVYRASNLSKYIILSARLALKKGESETIAASVSEYRRYRFKTQGVAGFSAGCVFRNPPGDSAGRLIDAAGLKGRHVNDAYVSRHHANFIINKGCAKAKDVLQLMGVIRKVVKKNFNILLEPEVKIWR